MHKPRYTGTYLTAFLALARIDHRQFLAFDKGLEEAYTNNIANLFEQFYILLLSVHECIQQIYLIDIKYLTLLMLNTWKLENHQSRVLSIICHKFSWHMDDE